ncbi:hypothetical protein OPV22_022893 [Ensete ventricosum]|uniref:DUF4283 domain-containing protein n=1 Tax=Ensete ventricosum TaxID=4639 RepID=A0AAV8PC72_ENSVE|nr:hypothetical protein OPV22_022893 [Ensete ventricosum]
MMLEQKVQTLTCWTWGCSDYESLREGGEQQRRRRPDITEEEEEEETKAAIGSSLPSIVGAPSVDGGFLYLVPVESQRDLALLEQDLWGFFIGPKDAEVAVQGRVIIRTWWPSSSAEGARPAFARASRLVLPPVAARRRRGLALSLLEFANGVTKSFPHQNKLLFGWEKDWIVMMLRYNSSSLKMDMQMKIRVTSFMVTAWKEVYSSGKTTENPTGL